MYKNIVFITLACILFSIQSLNAQGNAALVAESMREFQVRHRAVFGKNYQWPEVFNCRDSGTPAPPNPSGSFYGSEVNDPERLAELASAIQSAVSITNLPEEFVSNYPVLKSGGAQSVETHNLASLGPAFEAPVNSSNSAGILAGMIRGFSKLNYIYHRPSVSSRRIKQAIAYQGESDGELLIEAVNGIHSYDTHLGPIENDYTDWHEGWFKREFRIPHQYEVGDIATQGPPTLTVGDFFEMSPFPKIGISEYLRSTEFVGGAKVSKKVSSWRYEALQSALGYFEYRVVKGVLSILETVKDFAQAEVELFLKVSDIGLGVLEGFVA